MIRVILYLVVIGVLALGIGWLADRPGEVAIVWQGWRVETSVMVTAAAIVALVVIVMILWAILRAILRSPHTIGLMLRTRRGARGYHALSQGLVAIGSGDARAARRFAAEAQRLAPGEPLTLLLAAQAAQLSGERGAAERTFRTMAGREDTKLLGLHGLFVEARRRNDAMAARLYAEEAAQTAPALGWAAHAVLEFRSAAGDWVGALEALERASQSGLIDKAAYRRQRAVLLTARALALEEIDRDASKALAQEAVKLAPDLVPSAALAGRYLGEAGELRRASRVIETAWRANPHPDLAQAYAYLRFGDSARDRLERVRALANKMIGHPEGALAVARAALDAREFGLARTALAPLLAAPTRRVALLMAEIERIEHGDEGRAREWTARAAHAAPDPAWTADGVVSDRWLPVSPVSGQLDAFQWRVPVAELEPPARSPHEDERTIPLGEAIAAGTEPSADAAPAQPKSSEPPDVEPAPNPVDDPSANTRPDAPGSVVAKADGAGVPVGPDTEPPRPSRLAEPVIPLMRAPDDPGPDPEPSRMGATLGPARPPGWDRA